MYFVTGVTRLLCKGQLSVVCPLKMWCWSASKKLKASRILDITPEYVSRSFKRTLVDLLAEKLIMKLH
jgi:hypothetical protein